MTPRMVPLRDNDKMFFSIFEWLPFPISASKQDCWCIPTYGRLNNWKWIVNNLHAFNWALGKYVCFPLLILRSEMFPSQGRYHLTAICPRDTYGSHLGLTWLSPKNIIQYCPGCAKSFASVGSVKNLLSWCRVVPQSLQILFFFLFHCRNLLNQ